VTRCQYLLQQGTFVADICYYYGEDAPVGFFYSQLPAKIPRGYDFDACNTEILKQMKVDRGRIVLPSGMSYAVLLLPNSDRMTPGTLRTIAELVKAGATVVGPKPRLSPSLIDFPACDESVRQLANEVWGNCDGKTIKSHTYGAGSVEWGKSLEDILKAPADFSSDDNNLRFIHRRLGTQEIYFVSNQSDKDVLSQSTFRVGGLAPELWHPDTGTRELAAVYNSEQSRTSLPLQFGPSGSVFIVFRQPAARAVSSVEHEGIAIVPPSTANQASALNLPIIENGKVAMLVSKPGKYSFKLSDGNAQTVSADRISPSVNMEGPWQLQFQKERGAPASAILPNLISWSDAADEGIKYFSGTATYLKTFEIPPDLLSPGIRVVLNLGDVKNLARVTLNGKSFQTLWKPPFRVDVTSALRQGQNEVQIEVANLWPNRLIGDKRLPPERRVNWVSYNPYQSDSPLLPSGLLGPVNIEVTQRIEVRQ
jgi:hypothetical protein